MNNTKQTCNDLITLSESYEAQKKRDLDPLSWELRGKLALLIHTLNDTENLDDGVLIGVHTIVKEIDKDVEVLFGCCGY